MLRWPEAHILAGRKHIFYPAEVGLFPSCAVQIAFCMRDFTAKKKKWSRVLLVKKKSSGTPKAISVIIQVDANRFICL